jgi:hypothetical protein
LSSTCAGHARRSVDSLRSNFLCTCPAIVQGAKDLPNPYLSNVATEQSQPAASQAHLPRKPLDMKIHSLGTSPLVHAPPRASTRNRLPTPNLQIQRTTNGNSRLPFRSLKSLPKHMFNNWTTRAYPHHVTITAIRACGHRSYGPNHGTLVLRLLWARHPRIFSPDLLTRTTHEKLL